MAAVAVAVQALAAARGLALAAARGLVYFPFGTSQARYGVVWRCRFARLPSSYLAVSALWWEQEAEGVKADTEMGA